MNYRLYFSVLGATCLFTLSAQAQIRVNNPQETTERHVEGRVNNKIDQGVNRGLDKIEEGIGNIFRKKEKNPQPKQDDAATLPSPNSGSGSGQEAQADATSPANKSTGTASPKSLKAYSKFDFVPGEKILAVEDFSQDAVGDFPAKWNTNASGEVVAIDGQSGKWLQFANVGIFYPEFVNNLPENFTMEFDMLTSESMSEMQSGLKIVFPINKERNLKFDQHFNSQPQAGVDIHPVSERGSSTVWVNDKSLERILENTLDVKWNTSAINHVSVWKQKSRLRVYLNETKIWDIPKAFVPDVTYSMLFATHIFDGTAYMSNLRVAVGAPDTRNKLITEGKFSTTGILFDVNSDRIKPESYGVLKEIGTILKENSAVKVKIIGHTDSDGDETTNLALSKRRAIAVKNALSAEFNIEAGRLETDGKGESQPLAPNTTNEGKASNRRVEFIKL